MMDHGGPGMLPMSSPSLQAPNAQSQVAPNQQIQAQAQPPSNPNQVSLSVLIEYLVQKIYHELR